MHYEDRSYERLFCKNMPQLFENVIVSSLPITQIFKTDINIIYKYVVKLCIGQLNRVSQKGLITSVVETWKVKQTMQIHFFKKIPVLSVQMTTSVKTKFPVIRDCQVL